MLLAATAGPGALGFLVFVVFVIAAILIFIAMTRSMRRMRAHVDRGEFGDPNQQGSTEHDAPGRGPGDPPAGI